MIENFRQSAELEIRKKIWKKKQDEEKENMLQRVQYV